MTVHDLSNERLVKTTFSSPSFAAEIAATYRESAGTFTGTGAPNPYALQPDTLGFLKALLEKQSPRSMFEFGCGVSTLLFAEWAAAHDAKLISLENDLQWVNSIESQLSDEQRQQVQLVHAPLLLQRGGLRLFLDYGNLDAYSADVAASALI